MPGGAPGELSAVHSLAPELCPGSQQWSLSRRKVKGDKFSGHIVWHDGVWVVLPVDTGIPDEHGISFKPQQVSTSTHLSGSRLVSSVCQRHQCQQPWFKTKSLMLDDRSWFTESSSYPLRWQVQPHFPASPPSSPFRDPILFSFLLTNDALSCFYILNWFPQHLMQS